MPEIASPTDDVRSRRGSAAEVFAVTLKLGVTSFGGPVAHIGYFHDAFVVRRHWLDERAFADLLALCQFLPGPASSQLIFAVGLRRAGVIGALAASLGFMLPSAILMTAAAFGFAALEPGANAGWLHGLKVAAVAVVANAVWSMARRMCPDPARASLAAGATIVTLLWPGAGAQIAAIGLGAIAGGLLFRSAGDREETAPEISRSGRHWPAVLSLGVFAALLVLLPVASHLTGGTTLAVGNTFYRTGALVFGGGHVVLPLLESGVVDPGWVGEETFLAGYGTAQAVPGPLFTFAAYLGAAMQAGPGGSVGAGFCLVAIFLPGWLLVGGAAPFWESWRRLPTAQTMLEGTNAAVVGILLAALYDPVWRSGIAGASELAVGLAAFGLLAWWKTPAWVLVLGCTAAGVAFL